MNKLILSLGVALALTLTACGNSVDSKIDKLEKLTTECVELGNKAMTGDQDAAKKLDKKLEEASKIADELQKADLTEEQQKRIFNMGVNAASQMSDDAVKAATEQADQLIDNATEQANELIDEANKQASQLLGGSEE